MQENAQQRSQKSRKTFFQMRILNSNYRFRSM